MAIYIKIPISPNNPIFTQEDFAADYKATTGEGYVLGNMLEEAGVNQLTGSHRITEAQAVELKGRWPMMRYYIDFPPSNEWTPKIYEDE